MEYNPAPTQAPGAGASPNIFILILKAAVLILIVMWGINYYLKKTKPDPKPEKEPT